MRVTILGCGYTGAVLAKNLVAAEHEVVATTTRQERLEAIRKSGASAVVAATDDPESMKPVLENADAVVYLAPPGNDNATYLANAIRNAAPSTLSVFVYGSTTGVFGDHGDAWIDETTPPRSVGSLGERRLEMERAFADAGLPLRVVRIAGIYGPGRTLAHVLTHKNFLPIEGARPTSRIHVEDLARLLEAMLGPGAPPLAIGCDDAPATTQEVARFTCQLLGLEMPAPISLEEAAQRLSPMAQELRLFGRSCRSLVREKMIGALMYPSYKEGVPASLRAEGVLDSGLKRDRDR